MRAFTKALDAQAEKVREAVNEGARAVRNVARRRIRSKDKGGRVYLKRERYNKGEGAYRAGQTYRASAPGESPAQSSGHLVQHVMNRNAKKGTTRFKATVYSTSPHSILLEYGTVNMAPRPFMGPAAQEAKANNYKVIKRAAKKMVQSATGAARAQALKESSR